MPLQPPQNHEDEQQQDEDMSMRDTRKQAPKRNDENGNPILDPRAQQQRPQSPNMGGSAGGAAGNTAEKTAESFFTKYAPYIIIGGGIGGAVAITDLFHTQLFT